MNGSLINSNFAAGILVARNLNRQDQVLTGITAGQMGPSSAVGIFGLKRLVDDRAEAEERARRGEAERDAAKAKLDTAVALIATWTRSTPAAVDAWLADPKVTAAVAQAQSGSGTIPPTAGANLPGSPTPTPTAGTPTPTPTAGTPTPTPTAGTPTPAPTTGTPTPAPTAGTPTPTPTAGTPTPTPTVAALTPAPTAGAPTPVTTESAQPPIPAGSPGTYVTGTVGQTIYITDDRRQYDPRRMRAFKNSKKIERRSRFVLLSNWPIGSTAP